MSYFGNKLDARVTENDSTGSFVRTVTLLSDLIFYDEVHGKIVVPKGFESDGASVPKWFWNLYPPFGKYLPAAVVHDLLCVQGNDGICALSSKEAARVFYTGMRACGVGRWTSWKMYQAVLWFGPRWS
jgi:hypothetical protein